MFTKELKFKTPILLPLVDGLSLTFKPFFDDTEYSSDPATASFLNSGGNYVTIDTSGVTNMSQISIDSSTPGQYIITAYPTTSGSTVTTTAVDNLKSAMAQIGILPPEDYSENSSNGNIRVEIKIQSKEIGAIVEIRRKLIGP